MTSSTFSFLSGRTALEAPSARAPRRAGRRRSAVLQALHRRVRASQLAASQREHQRRDHTDAYLDRSGLSSVDWTDTLTRHVQR